jgi:CCR4-NOT transcription complex subunit 9
LYPPAQENEKYEFEKIVSYIQNLKSHDKREEALIELGKKRESYGNLAPLLWYSVGTIAVLI